MPNGALLSVPLKDSEGSASVDGAPMRASASLGASEGREASPRCDYLCAWRLRCSLCPAFLNSFQYRLISMLFLNDSVIVFLFPEYLPRSLRTSQRCHAPARTSRTISHSPRHQFARANPRTASKLYVGRLCYARYGRHALLARRGTPRRTRQWIVAISPHRQTLAAREQTVLCALHHLTRGLHTSRRSHYPAPSLRLAPRRARRTSLDAGCAARELCHP